MIPAGTSIYLAEGGRIAYTNNDLSILISIASFWQAWHLLAQSGHCQRAHDEGAGRDATQANEILVLYAVGH